MMKAHLLEVIEAGVFATWWILSLLGQNKRRLNNYVRSMDFFHLIPSCRFFAPYPASRDYHLEYRIRDVKGLQSPWKRIPLHTERTWLTTFWHPQKRTRKAFNSTVRRLLKSRSIWGDTGARKCLPYLQFLLLATTHACTDQPKAIQFRILSAHDFAVSQNIRLTFKSDWHRTGYDG